MDGCHARPMTARKMAGAMATANGGPGRGPPLGRGVGPSSVRFRGRVYVWVNTKERERPNDHDLLSSTHSG